MTATREQKRYARFCSKRVEECYDNYAEICIFSCGHGDAEEFAVSKFSVFSGCFGDDDAVWLESVDGLEAACNRMKEIAGERPGKYFVFSSSAKKAVESIDTTEQE
jgi:hypothetical protein